MGVASTSPFHQTVGVVILLWWIGCLATITQVNLPGCNVFSYPACSPGQKTQSLKSLGSARMDTTKKIVEFSTDRISFVNSGSDIQKKTQHLRNHSEITRKLRVALAKGSDKVRVHAMYSMYA